VGGEKEGFGGACVMSKVLQGSVGFTGEYKSANLYIHIHYYAIQWHTNYRKSMLLFLEFINIYIILCILYYTYIYNKYFVCMILKVI